MRSKRSPFEIMVITIVVTLSVILSASLYSGRLKAEKASMLVGELSQLRSAVILYMTVNKVKPPSLDMLSTAEYEIKGVKRPYLERMPLPVGERMIDPFGNPYRYDPETGWVSSTTPGYERW